MPHVIVEYSSNLEDAVDIGKFCNHLRETAVGIEAFPSAGIRVRAFAAPHCSIADGNPKHGHVDISIRLRGGREPDVKMDATARMSRLPAPF